MQEILYIPIYDVFSSLLFWLDCSHAGATIHLGFFFFFEALHILKYLKRTVKHIYDGKISIRRFSFSILVLFNTGCLSDCSVGLHNF